MQSQRTLKTIKMTAMIVIIVLVLGISNCFAQSDGNFLIYNAQKNKCLGDALFLLRCNTDSKNQQFRWTSESRIFNVGQKKCLGTGSKREGNTLQWYICDAKSDLQKWECKDDLLFGLKNESLYLSVHRDSNLITVSKDPGDEGKWTIHGTMKSVCSQPYEELYTLQGNAFGRPCHFPFRFKDIWYADCTTEGSPNNRLWCSTEMDYKDSETWGYCPTNQIDEYWSKNPLSDVYYQVNEDSALTWYQARKSCQQQGGDLLSITEPHEQAFISGKAVTTGPALWTGLNSLDSLSGWQWINGQPLRYLKWLSGQPSSQPGHSCGVINQHYDSKWSTDVCSAKHGYICQRGLSTPTVPPVEHTGYCHSPWIPYSGHCYFLNRSKRTWLDARDACRREGGDLLSILNTEEQSFVISQLGYLKTDELWIGFNDLKTPMLFEWSDHSSVPFAWWETNEPSHNDALKEDCVLMNGEEGKWADTTCQQKYGYICKKKTSLTPSTNDTMVTNPGCIPGWIRYGYYCYLAGTETRSFAEAKQMCEKSGSYLADITNKIENAFLVSLVGARPEKHFWIGLSNQRDRHTFEWTNTNKVLFTHFNAGMPGGKQGCVAMTTGMLAGLWDVLSCTNKEKYICKQKAEGVVITPAPPTTPAPSCSEGWYPLLNRDYCFKLFNMGFSKTWSEALDFCRELGGDLLSIHSDYDIPQQHFRYVSAAWIGYSIQNPDVGYVWSDGSSSSYENWEEGEPNNYNNVENCVTLTSYFWRGWGKWNDLHCEDQKNWFCEIKKGVTPKKVNITEKIYNTTDDGWIIFKENQYYIGYRSMSMKEARRFCKHRHGDLVVINDEQERVFLWHQAKKKYDDMYIGMHIDLDKTFTWMDGSPVVFQAWSQNQPAFMNNDERCVKMTLSQGLWESLNCGDEERFICKRSGSPPINSTVAPTEPPIGGCAPDWVKFQGNCYNIKLTPKTWDEARSYCRHLGGDLASITDRLHQAFFTLRTNENTPDLWLGFSNLAGGNFKWTDGSPVHFTSWAKGQPSSYSYSWIHFELPLSCVVMGGMQRPEPGKWVTKDCNDTNGFICSRAIDHFIKPSPTEAPKTFIKLGNSSYMVIQRNLTWKEAQHHCEVEQSYLATIRDMITQSYIELQTHKLGQPLWIGLNSMETDGYFLWIDNWHLNMERWYPSEPKRNNPCVYVDVDGNWKTAQCNQTFYSVCKKSTDIAPTRPAQYPGECPKQNEVQPISWLPYRGHCYAFPHHSMTWGSASLFCKKTGANLASIEDQNEEKFIENHIDLLGSDGRNFWIGLYKSSIGHWLWMDNTVVDYINWGQTTSDDNEYYLYDDDKSCAIISNTNKKWRELNCQHNFRFICKAKKVLNTTTEVKRPGHGGGNINAIVSVIAVTAVLCLVAGSVYFYYYHRISRKQTADAAFENPMYHSTVDPLPVEKDTKILVDNMEINEKQPPL